MGLPSGSEVHLEEMSTVGWPPGWGENSGTGTQRQPCVVCALLLSGRLK